MRIIRFGVGLVLWWTTSGFCEGGTLHVPDPGLGITTLQQALDAATAGDTILLAAGVHFGNAQVTGKAGLRVRGVSTAKTILEIGRAHV